MYGFLIYAGLHRTLEKASNRPTLGAHVVLRTDVAGHHWTKMKAERGSAMLICQLPDSSVSDCSMPGRLVPTQPGQKKLSHLEGMAPEVFVNPSTNICPGIIFSLPLESHHEPSM